MKVFDDFNFDLFDYSSHISQYKEKLRILQVEKDNELIHLLNLQKQEILKHQGDIVELQKNVMKKVEDINEVKLQKKLNYEERKKLEIEADEQNIMVNEKIGNKNDLEKKLLSVERSIKEHEKYISDMELKNEKTIQRASDCLELYRKNLGIRILCTGHRTLAIIFTQINRNDPSQEYTLEMSIENDDYKLHRTVPEIPSLDVLQRRLNETKNLSGFLFHLRSLFQQMD